MASIGPNNFSTFTTAAGIGSADWSAASSAQTSDNVAANYRCDSGSFYLKATNCNPSVPAGATINGIVVEVQKKADVGTKVQDSAAQLIKGGTISGTNKASGTTWSVVYGYTTYGSSTDLWGLTLTPTDVNATNFGFAFAGSDDVNTAGGTAYVDHIRITIYYTASGSSSQQSVTIMGW